MVQNQPSDPYVYWENNIAALLQLSDIVIFYLSRDSIYLDFQ